MTTEQIELDYRCPECGREDTTIVPEYHMNYVTCVRCKEDLTVQHEGGLQVSVWRGWYRP